MAELIRLLILFALIMILLRKKVPLGIVMIGATVVLGLFSCFSLATFLHVLVATITDSSTLLLLFFLYMVSLLEKIFRQSGKLDRMIKAMESYIPGRRLRLIIMPAFLGFLASPGGAMFSAPFVEKAGEPLGLSGEEKTFINYWFRHLWEYFLPLYPAIILASAILAVPIESLVKAMYPCTLAAIAGGIIFGLLPLKLKAKEAQVENTAISKSGLVDLILGILPVAALLLMVIAFHVNMALALFLVLLFEMAASRFRLRELPALLKKGMSFDIFLSVLGILLFKEALKTSTLTMGVSTFFSHQGIPLPVLFFLLPFLVGFLTGVTQAPIGIAFPLLLGLAPVPGSLGLFCFAFASAVLGVMLSPTHLCLILTAEYFHIDFTRIYRYLVLPVTAVLAVAMLLYLR